MANVKMTHPQGTGSITVREDMVDHYIAQGWAGPAAAVPRAPAKKAAKRVAKKAAQAKPAS